eukprot:5248756-Prorocentrum_lima.AAC.1
MVAGLPMRAAHGPRPLVAGPTFQAQSGEQSEAVAAPGTQKACVPQQTLACLQWNGLESAWSLCASTQTEML